MGRRRHLRVVRPERGLVLAGTSAATRGCWCACTGSSCTRPTRRQVKIGNVDQVICVSDHYARLTREKTGWPAAKIITVPNPLDVLQFDRPKLDGARFHLGMISMVPSRKRLDLALDVLEELRRDDDRYQLFVKSGMPWEHWWVWQHQEERVALLRGVPPGAALAAAARRRGVRRRAGRTCPPGCAGSGSSCRPATTSRSTWPRPRAWRRGRCR